MREPAMLVAYDGDTPVLTTLSIHGTGRTPTPVGVFRIQRRVANETMNSETIGIPRFGPGGYYLTNVLFTQYFTGDGASLHYNYWSSAFGYAGSHGCLGLTYKDSAFLWDWAHVGTPLIIHY
jgi:lipoprotein-anchoring transpeptidase ErfK/SrfK